MDWWLPMGDNWPRLVLTAGLIGAVSLLEAISIAKALAERNGDTVDADEELLGARASWKERVHKQIAIYLHEEGCCQPRRETPCGEEHLCDHGAPDKCWSVGWFAGCCVTWSVTVCVQGLECATWRVRCSAHILQLVRSHGLLWRALPVARQARSPALASLCPSSLD